MATHAIDNRPPAEPGLFLGYGWAPGDRPIDAGMMFLSENPFKSVEEACDAATREGFDSCHVFKVYAVDVKKYARKFVQED